MSSTDKKLVRVHVDKNICSGHARCNATAPNVFELNDEGYNDSDDHEIPDSDIADAIRGMSACPEQAITIVDEDGQEIPEKELHERLDAS